ncbi:hypothetical protein [Streptococcus parauberis]|uniref:Lipoprotein n=1 Tax=Streptococcus parauberis KRS-02083 TaxID=1207545 RepID=A0ABN0IQ15_9STRE|nr:hypothetical protein [Streptococcus parauberis]EMG24929.1 hypothetical protein SPJ1_1800 [Streptococcus parauberis KRS-02083]
MRKYFGIFLIVCSCLLIACSKETSKGQESQRFSPNIEKNGAVP